MCANWFKGKRNFLNYSKVFVCRKFSLPFVGRVLPNKEALRINKKINKEKIVYVADV